MAVLPKNRLLPLLPPAVRDVMLGKHRLHDTGRLQDKAQVQDFVEECGIVTLFAGTELPSVQEAIAGELVTNNSNERYGPGFGIAWIWGKDIPDDERCVYGSFFREKASLIARRHWPTLGALSILDYRRARKSSRLSASAFKMAAYIDEHGPTRTDVLRQALGYTGGEGGARFRRARRELERSWTIVAVCRGEHAGAADTHTWDLTARWLPDDICAEAEQISRQDAMADLIQAGVESAMVVEEQGVSRWFGWTRTLTSKTINRLLDAERLYRVGGSKPLLITESIVDIWPSE